MILCSVFYLSTAKYLPLCSFLWLVMWILLCAVCVLCVLCVLCVCVCVCGLKLSTTSTSFLFLSSQTLVRSCIKVWSAVSLPHFLIRRGEQLLNTVSQKKKTTCYAIIVEESEAEGLQRIFGKMFRLNPLSNWCHFTSAFFFFVIYTDSVYSYP